MHPTTFIVFEHLKNNNDGKYCVIERLYIINHLLHRKNRKSIVKSKQNK